MGKRDHWYVPGYKVVTEPQISTLEYLISQDDEYGGAWCGLDHVWPMTIKSLLRRDWIQRSARLDGTGDDYKITNRGRVAAKECREYTPRDYRYDGICAKCGERPKSRARAGYCEVCQKQANRELREKNPRYHTRHKGKVCKNCKKNTITHHKLCNKCHYQNQRAMKRRHAQEIEAGIRDAPICPTCNERPRAIRAGMLIGYCVECNRNHYKGVNKRKYARKMQSRIDRLFGKR